MSARPHVVEHALPLQNVSVLQAGENVICAALTVVVSPMRAPGRVELVQCSPQSDLVRHQLNVGVTSGRPARSWTGGYRHYAGDRRSREASSSALQIMPVIRVALRSQDALLDHRQIST
jgi:hypothetical protein